MITPTTTARNKERLNTTHATVFVVVPPGPGPRVVDKFVVILEPSVKSDGRQKNVVCYKL